MIPFSSVKYWAGCIVFCSAVWVSCHRNSAPASVSAPSVRVTKPVVKNIVLYKEYPGYLSSEQSVDLVARVNGYLEQILYSPGAFVKEGQMLLVIEPSLYQEAVVQAEAALKTAQAQLYYATNNFDRMKEAAKSDAVSQIELIQSESNLDQAKADVKNAEAQLATARKNLSYCYIRAPFSGHISRNMYDVGAYINGAAQAVQLASLYKDAKMYAYFNIEDNQYLQMKKNNLPESVEIYTRGNLSSGYFGTLNYVSPNIELSTGTLNLRAEVDNPNGELKSGLYVTVKLPYDERESAVLVRDASVGTDQAGKFLYVVGDSSIVRYRHIETGQIVDDSLRLVIKGLSPDEMYVTSALLKVHDGMVISPVLSK